MDVAYSLEASEPAVLQFASYTPSYIMHATLLDESSGESPATATLYGPPDCLLPVVYDGAGHRTELPEWCASDSAAPASSDEGDDPATPPGSSAAPTPSGSSIDVVATPRERSLCTLTMAPSTSRGLPAAAALGLALVLAAWRRRQR